MMNSIAGIAVALEEALQPEFKRYAQQVVRNARVLSEELKNLDFTLISGGTDTHLILIDIRNKQPDGVIAGEMLQAADIIVNKNAIPEGAPINGTNLWRPPGIRIGTPAVTTRGMVEKEMKEIARLMNDVLTVSAFTAETQSEDIVKQLENNASFKAIQSKVEKLTQKFPVYKNKT